MQIAREKDKKTDDGKEKQRIGILKAISLTNSVNSFKMKKLKSKFLKKCKESKGEDLKYAIVKTVGNNRSSTGIVNRSTKKPNCWADTA